MPTPAPEEADGSIIVIYEFNSGDLFVMNGDGTNEPPGEMGNLTFAGDRRKLSWTGSPAPKAYKRRTRRSRRPAASSTTWSVDLFLARDGLSSSWETIALGLPNTGQYDWLVTGPTTQDPKAFLRVLVQHVDDTEGEDASDYGFRIR